MKPVYDYMDYRCFLKDRFSDLKKRNPLFSYRSFNRLAGTKSSGFLKLVVDGKRNLGDEGVAMVARGFKLNDDERKYFESLVKFNQAGRHDEKDLHFRQLSQHRRFIAAKPLTAAQYHLFSHWYYVALLEMLRMETDERKTVRWIQERIRPKVGVRELNRAVRELEQLGLLKISEDGSLSPREAMLTTEDEVSSLSVANFHVQMSGLAARSVAQDPASQREFSTLTVATSEKSFQRIKQEIQRFRKKLHSIIEQENGSSRTLVAHLNLQLFQLGLDPNSATPKESDDTK